MCPLRRHAEDAEDWVGVGSVQKIHDGGSEEMVKDMGAGRGTVDGMFGGGGGVKRGFSNLITAGCGRK